MQVFDYNAVNAAIEAGGHFADCLSDDFAHGQRVCERAGQGGDMAHSDLGLELEKREESIAINFDSARRFPKTTEESIPWTCWFL
jgi:hypothetical protein